MTEDEIYEDLEVTFGKAPQSVEEKNMAWLLKVLNEHANEGGDIENVPEPSLDAVAMTTIAITTYPIRSE